MRGEGRKIQVKNAEKRRPKPCYVRFAAMAVTANAIRLFPHAALAAKPQIAGVPHIGRAFSCGRR